jgi:hypothetical protein
VSLLEAAVRRRAETASVTAGGLAQANLHRFNVRRGVRGPCSQPRSRTLDASPQRIPPTRCPSDWAPPGNRIRVLGPQRFLVGLRRHTLGVS